MTGRQLRRMVGGVALLGAGTLAACATTRLRTGSGFNISSVQSNYSRTARLSVSLSALLSSRDSIVILVDSGFISAPGLQPPDVSDTAPHTRHRSGARISRLSYYRQGVNT